MNKDIDEVMDEAVEATFNNSDLPEAPASANIKVWINGYGVQITMRSNKVNDVVREVEFIVNMAKEKGWKSKWDEAPISGGSFGNCPKCQSPLKELAKDGVALGLKCSSNKWNKMTKRAEGCDYIDWYKKNI